MKVYKKPEVRIERFTLSKHIAACAYTMNASDKNNCYATSSGYVGGVKVFANTNTSCDITEESAENGAIEGFCYTGSVAGSNVFSS